jgi:hypothetical protein
MLNTGQGDWHTIAYKRDKNEPTALCERPRPVTIKSTPLCIASSRTPSARGPPITACGEQRLAGNRNIVGTPRPDIAILALIESVRASLNFLRRLFLAGIICPQQFHSKQPVAASLRGNMIRIMVETALVGPFMIGPNWSTDWKPKRV